MNGIACEAERPEQERRDGLLGEARKAEPSNSQRGAAERERLRDVMNGIACEAERLEQDAKGRVAWRGLDGRA